MSEYRKALLFAALDSKKKEYTHYDRSEVSSVSAKSLGSTDLYLKDIQQYDMLEKEEERLLLKQAQSGDLMAQDRLIQANLRLVVRIARRYHRDYLSLADLISEGNFGLIHATRKFDLSLDHRFSTYAAWWVQHYIESYLLNQVRIVRLPVHISKKIKKVEKIENTLTQSLQNDITQKEISQKAGMDIRELSRLKIWSSPAMTIDSSDDDHHLTLIETLSTHHQDNIDPCEEMKDLEKQNDGQLQYFLSLLEPLEKEVVYCRLGLKGLEEMTFQEMSIHLSLSKDRVRGIFNKAIKKMEKFFLSNRQKIKSSRQKIH
jgi:RNA polymerase sigma factor (sigma-70 family)